MLLHLTNLNKINIHTLSTAPVLCVRKSIYLCMQTSALTTKVVLTQTTFPGEALHADNMALQVFYCTLNSNSYASLDITS